MGALLDATFDERFARALVAAAARGERIASAGGEIILEAFGEWPTANEPGAEMVVRNVGADQSNNSLVVDERLLLKIYRRLREGIQPEIEMSRFLSQEAGFANTPALRGLVEHRPDEDDPTVLCAFFDFVRNQGDCWQVIVGALERHLDDLLLVSDLPERDAREEPTWAYPLDLPIIIGRRTAEMHSALAIDTLQDAFRSEPVTQADIEAWVEAARSEARAAMATVERRAERTKDDVAGTRLRQLIEARGNVEARLDELASLTAEGIKTRIHGDYHLGQMLVVETDVFVIDFEGEPQTDTRGEASQNHAHA